MTDEWNVKTDVRQAETEQVHEFNMQIFLESNFGVVLIIDIEVVLFAVFTISQFQTNYRSSLDRTDTSFSFQEISKQRMSDSSIDVNGEIDLNLNVTGKGGGQIAAIVIGVLVAVICILLILYFSCRWFKIKTKKIHICS